MIIAVTHENGNIFQHFGRTQEFKVYHVEEGQVISAEVVSAGGMSHGSLAILLDQWAVDLVICGGVGQGMRTRFRELGMDYIAGASGSCDEAVEDWLDGALQSDEDADCGCSDGHHHEHMMN